MGESVVTVTIGSILCPGGAQVKADEEILEMETDKINQALNAPASGKLTLNVKQGDVVKIGQVVGSVDTESVGVAVEEKKEEKQQPKETKREEGVRKQPDEYLKETVKREERAVSQDGKETRKKMTKLRKIIADRLVQVKNETAMLTTFNEVDMSAVIALREKEQESFQKKYGVKLGFMSFFVKAVIGALREFPEINARIEGDEIVYHNYFDIGLAVGTDRGLMVPVIRGADQLSYAEIEKALKELAEKARNGTIAVSDLQGGTFTITNGGVYGSLLSTPILNPPQSGILGMHSIVKRPIAVGDQIALRPMMYLALSYDHRIVDGKEAISFLMHIKKSLEQCTTLS